jgi:NADPH:quinone reductase-like Zn-dependent oxidoreductase
MRAVVVERFGGPEVLAAVELEKPSPISTEVLVEVHAAGVNPVDWKTRSGRGVAHWAGPPPFVPGWDVAGVVVEMGYGVTRFKPGDRVFGMPRFPRGGGAYAEYVTAPSLQLSLIPPGVDFVHAAALPLAALTVWHALVDAADIEAGQVVVVNGASGGVGHIAVQIAVARGAAVIALGRQASHAFLRSLGARDVVDREATPIGSCDMGADVVVDLVGGASTRLALTCLRPGGVLLAIADGADSETLLHASGLGVRLLSPLVEPDGRALDRIAALVKAGAVKPVVDSVLPLEQASEAHRRLEAGGVRGKVVLGVRRSGAL